MEPIHPRTIITRSIYLIVALVIILFGYGFIKKVQRRAAVVSELKSTTSENSFFHQFYAEDARKTLVRGIGLLAEGKTLGLDPDVTLDRALGLEKGMFDEMDPQEDASPRTLLIIDTLLANYDNAMKLGYSGDFRTITEMKSGELPPIPSGPESGRRAEIAPIIDPALSPGIEKVVANLTIRPPGYGGARRTDIETAAAKQLAGRLAVANVIENKVSERIIEALSADPDATKP